RLWGGGGGLPAPGEGPAGADGDALERPRGASDAARAGDLLERGLGGVLGTSHRSGTTTVVRTQGNGTDLGYGGVAKLIRRGRRVPPRGISEAATSPAFTCLRRCRIYAYLR